MDKVKTKKRKGFNTMKPYVQTYSVVIGSTSCNASCPFCVSKMTPKCNVTCEAMDINEMNLIKGGRLARDYGATTGLITGKGEPTLYADLVSVAIGLLDRIGFPCIELQTNGIFLACDNARELLNVWRGKGLNTICLSCVDFIDEKNRQIYGKNYFAMDLAADMIHSAGLSVRLCCMAVNGFIDSVEKVKGFYEFCKKNKVEQLTIRPLSMPQNTDNLEVVNWTKKNNISVDSWLEIRSHFRERAVELNSLVHGATVYDYNGQNICLSNCLTKDEMSNDIRQIIYFPDGHIRYDWCYEGAVVF